MLQATLPVAEALPALLDALAAGRNALLVAPPGAGKTTLVPPALLGASWRGDGRIVMLEPRRLAARAAARRIATLLGEPVGQTAGFRTRIDRAISDATRIEVVTEGLLVRRLHSDPALEGVACVILDEIHERSLDADLALALLLDVQRTLRPELRLVAMSATADVARIAPLLDAAVIESSGRAFPVEIAWAARDLADPRDLPAAMAAKIRTALAAQTGAVLAFLPGMAEILRTRDALGQAGAPVHILHGDIDPAAQDAALSGGRRVVLASAIAETSLTVEGVGAVVDCGLRRVQNFDAGRGMGGLVTRRISRAAATQRAGRAGRERPGLCFRLWTEADHRARENFDAPEILSADLAPLALDLAAWGTAEDALAFPDPPPAGALAAARALLARLGLLDDAGRITPLGRRAAGLAAHPRLARMMAAAPAEGAALACDLAALLEARGRGDSTDIRARLDRIDGATRRVAAQHRRRLVWDDRSLPNPPPLRGRGSVAATAPSPAERGRVGEGAVEPGALLALAFADRIAMARGEPGRFLLSGGGGASLPATDPLAREKFLVVAELDLAGRDARVRLAAPIDRATLDEVFGAAMQDATVVALENDAVVARRRRTYGALVLEEAPLPHPDPALAACALAEAALARGLAWDDPAANLRARVAIMRRLEGEAWPDLSDAALVADPSWLTGVLHGRTRLADAARVDLAAALAQRLTWEQRRALDAALPERVALRRGRSARIDYTAATPTLSARAQDFFGLNATPKLAGGRVKLQVELLSPAQRPIAVTADLEKFWKGGWSEVRKAMRGRYPKHAWPEDPSALQ
jgi:ATP-dependent helicase HrpB